MVGTDAIKNYKVVEVCDSCLHNSMTTKPEVRDMGRLQRHELCRHKIWYRFNRKPHNRSVVSCHEEADVFGVLTKKSQR
jgi:hypothetical protein